MYSSHFKPSDFVINNAAVPKVIIDRIFEFHLQPLNLLQDHCPFEVKVSENSCFRPYSYELSRNRSGNSQHAFGQILNEILDSKGACDITCEDFKTNQYALLAALIEYTDYIRFAVYNSFIHADYKDLYNGTRRLFKNESSGWKFVKNL